jgi:hypothetical protein
MQHIRYGNRVRTTLSCHFNQILNHPHPATRNDWYRNISRYGSGQFYVKTPTGTFTVN